MRGGTFVTVGAGLGTASTTAGPLPSGVDGAEAQAVNSMTVLSKTQRHVQYFIVNPKNSM
jgi:hypothetical protein